ncbi:hypothetical protein [Haloarchaeobius sp. HRN-SO-5]|uniref:hypothetical protein n=1 Tax=Haloarchaeobius sp. HRN-SO-5 TaxID=3446118 RepID=UPI003EBF13BA
MVRTVLRERRPVALAFGIALGLVAATIATSYTHVSLDVLTAMAVGVGGSSYYVAHYAGQFPQQDGFWRSFVRLFALLLLAAAFVPESLPFPDAVAMLVTIVSGGTLVQFSAFLDGFEGATTDDGTGGDGSDRASDLIGDASQS